MTRVISPQRVLSLERVFCQEIPVLWIWNL